MAYIDFISVIHNSTTRDYLARVNNPDYPKAKAAKLAKQWGYDYWDGNRAINYGGYKYMEGRWEKVAREMVKHYKLPKNPKILDVGCGKAFLLYEMKLLLPQLRISGFDISKHGLANAREEIRDSLFIHRAQEPYPYKDDEFDLVISLGCFHNLRIFELQTALAEVERVGRQGYVMLESYRNEQEQFNLQCWALTCESFFDEEEWCWVYEHFGYTGDYEFIYFE